MHHCEITRGARKSTRAQWNPTQSKGKSPPVVACSAFALHTRPTLSVHHAELKITGCRPAVLIEPRCSPSVPSHPATLQGQGVSTDAEGCTAPPVPARSHPGHHHPLSAKLTAPAFHNPLGHHGASQLPAQPPRGTTSSRCPPPHYHYKGSHLCRAAHHPVGCCLCLLWEWLQLLGSVHEHASPLLGVFGGAEAALQLGHPSRHRPG